MQQFVKYTDPDTQAASLTIAGRFQVHPDDGGKGIYNLSMQWNPYTPLIYFRGTLEQCNAIIDFISAELQEGNVVVDVDRCIKNALG